MVEIARDALFWVVASLFPITFAAGGFVAIPELLVVPGAIVLVLVVIFSFILAGWLVFGHV